MNDEGTHIVKPDELVPPSRQGERAGSATDRAGTRGRTTKPNYRYMARLKALERLDVNYRLENRSEVSEANGWRIDSYEADLPPEPPGKPIDGGSFAHARAIINSYSFVDPGLIRGYFDPEAPLLGRVMLLKVRVFLIFRFDFGVRVNKVIDEVSEDEYVGGFGYQTLQGHFEMGEIAFTVAKRKDTGKVFFRINAYSKLGHIENVIYRIGAFLFARRLQIRFARYALKQVQQMVAQRLGQTEAVKS